MNNRKIKAGINYLKKNGVKKSVKKLYFKYLNKKQMNNVSQNYYDYIKNNEPNEVELEKQKKEKFEYSPLISIVIPLYNTPKEFFNELIDSILKQTYTNWQLCLADGSKETFEYISEEINDDRILYKLLEKNGGISENTNEAIKMSTGEYIVFCDHDDLLAPNALYEIIKALNENKKTDFIYSDEDILDGNVRKNPHFKPDFSIDLLRSYNYICHLVTVKRELLNKVGMLRKEYDGAQDYDFVLRATNKAENIVHISKVLYHWRSHSNSTAGSSESKTYVFEAGKKAIEYNLKENGISGTVSMLEDEPGRYRINYEIIGNPKVSIIIPNKDAKSDLKNCIDSILKSTYNNYEIIIVENNSTKEETFKYYEKLQKEYSNIFVKEMKIDEFNYSKINNYGEKFAKGDYILLLNNDTKVISNDWIENMLGICQREDVGIVGAKLLYPDNTTQHVGVVVGIGGVAGHVNTNLRENEPGYFSRATVINNFSAVTAACLMVKRNLYEEVGGLTEEFKVAFNDIDFCLKVREKGYLVVLNPFSKLTHYESKTRGMEDTKEKIKRFESEMDLFKSKWKNILENGDPYYNINLRLDNSNFYINTNKILRR